MSVIQLRNKFLRMIDNNKPLSDEDMRDLMCEFEESSEEEYSDDGWTKTVECIVKLKNRYFRILYDTNNDDEDCDQYFQGQPEEVSLYEMMRPVRRWIPKDEKERNEVDVEFVMRGLLIEP